MNKLLNECSITGTFMLLPLYTRSEVFFDDDII